MLVLGHERGYDFDDLILLTARETRHLIKHFLHFAGWAAFARDSDGSDLLPDDDGYFWLAKLNEFSGNFVNAEMVKAFIVSGEYRQRFGP